MKKVRMSTPQRAYALAKAAYGAAQKLMDERLDAEFPPELFTDDWSSPEQTDLAARYGTRAEVVAAEYNVPQLRQLLRNAEDHLLEWGHSKIQRLPSYTTEIRELFVKHAKQMANIRKDLLDMTFKLPA